MATIKVSEAEGVVLDWLVMKIEFDHYEAQGDSIKPWVKELHSKGEPCGQPSTDWAQGGPIVEREQITTGSDGLGWCAGKPWDNEWISSFIMRGPTPLIAAMRCYVASKLGTEVEVPDELITLEK